MSSKRFQDIGIFLSIDNGSPFVASRTSNIHRSPERTFLSLVPDLLVLLVGDPWVIPTDDSLDRSVAKGPHTTYSDGVIAITDCDST
jgi:hypothetical protein